MPYSFFHIASPQPEPEPTGFARYLLMLPDADLDALHQTAMPLSEAILDVFQAYTQLHPETTDEVCLYALQMVFGSIEAQAEEEAADA